MTTVILVLTKLLTFLFDRRQMYTSLIIGLLGVIGGVLISPETAELLALNFDEGYVALIQVVSGLVVIFKIGDLGVNLVKSWTERPPSGLMFKEAYETFLSESLTKG